MRRLKVVTRKEVILWNVFQRVWSRRIPQPRSILIVDVEVENEEDKQYMDNEKCIHIQSARFLAFNMAN